MKAKVTISRASDDIVRITVKDSASSIAFVVASMTAEAYGFAITGLAEQDASIEVNGLGYVGKQRITERREVVCPLTTYDRYALQEWLRANAQEEGWLLNSYLGSQSSVSHRDGKTLLRYSVTKYVDQQAL